MKPDMFVVVDNLKTADGNAHDYELLFQLDTTSYALPSEYKNAVLSRYGRKYDVLIIPLDDGGDLSLVSGRTEPTYRGWYNGRNEANLHEALTVERKIAGATEYRFATLILPIESTDEYPKIARDGERVTVTHKGKKYAFDLSRLNEGFTR